MARYYNLHYDAEQQNLSWREEIDKKGIGEKLDGSYLLKTERLDMTVDEIWRTYILLTSVEAVFRA